MRRLFARWTWAGALDATMVALVIIVTVVQLHPSLLLSHTLITGGDTGSHLATPAYLRTTGNPFNFTPWYPGWLDGLPAYTFYFVLPDVLATFASYVIGFAVAMKLVTILGSVLMPITAYAMGRLFKAPRPIPVALAMATLPFLFDASFTIDGGNLFSTMAGEYAFSLSLALALLTIGLFARGVRTGRGYWLAALSLSATLASHVLPWLFSLGAIVVLVVVELFARWGHGAAGEEVVRGDHARPVRFAVGAGLLSAGLSAWWLLPFATSQKYTDSLNYSNYGANLHTIFSILGWFNATGGAAGDRWVIVGAVIAMVVAFVVRDRLGMVLAVLTFLSFWAYVVDPQSAIWDERLIPFWYISIHLIVGWLVGYVAWRWARYVPRRFRWSPFFAEGSNIGYPDDAVDDAERQRYEEQLTLALDASTDPRWQASRLVTATILIGLIGLLSTVPGLITPIATDLHLATGGNQVSAWANFNYSGYQAQPGWPEYHDVITTMESVAARYGCGRAMWEYSSDQNRFGTPEALMLLPYWTNNCVDSEEGLLMESSATTPYHYLDQAELSVAPSEPQRGLHYGSLNVAAGVRHLQQLGVKYFMAFSPQVIAEADADKSLQLVATTKRYAVRWRIYLVKDSPLVQALTYLPNNVANASTQVGWLRANQTWWLRPKLQAVYAASGGPSTWPAANSVRSMIKSAPLPTVTVSDVKMHLQSLTFHVSKVGVPVLVKISYFPRWHATGASGPYRVSPNLMVVVPTSSNVSLNYTSTPALSLGNVTTDVTAIAGLLALVLTLRRRRIARR